MANRRARSALRLPSLATLLLALVALLAVFAAGVAAEEENNKRSEYGTVIGIDLGTT